MVLGASSSPSSEHNSATELHVTSPSDVAASGGAANTLIGGANANGGGNGSSGGGASEQPSPTPGSSIPTPAEFAQYDKYSTNKDALFGDEVVGKGTQVVAGTTLNVLYRGWLTTGLSFDAVTDPTKPFVFREGDHKVIPGWEEALLGMKVGGIRRLIIPPSVGYGAAGHPPIPPNAVLVFDVQLTAAQ
jgi:FKBP-type peptidyl-prolyl cis-trans isomerase FkpA